MPEHAQAPWHDDLLDYAKIGGAFTNLIQSIDDTKVISIEASFGQGKTYFRKNWAEQLRRAGEVVVEFDAQESDRTGDPLITLLGAMIRHVPQDDSDKWKEVSSKAKALAGVAARSVVKSIFRNGAEEIISAVQDGIDEKLPDYKILNKTMEDMETGLSKYAASIIGSQLAAEKAVKELPAQLDALKTALAGEGRIVILIDELDRCHPEYAIALLEAMKLVFNRKGFVFCLMVNPQYLENIAQHRFGVNVNGEAYLDKFIDTRLALKFTGDGIAAATKALALNLNVKNPLGTNEEFSVERAAEVAGQIAKDSGLSFRQIKNVIATVDLATRCYPAEPLDSALLLGIAFRDAISRTRQDSKKIAIEPSILPRMALTPEIAGKLIDALRTVPPQGKRENSEYDCQSFVAKNCKCLENLNADRYVSLPPISPRDGDFYSWYKVLKGLGPTYLPRHENILQMVHELQAPTT